MTFNSKFASPWLDNLSYNWDIFYKQGIVTHLKKNDYVFHEGDILNSVYVVLKGRIRTYLNTVDGKEKTLMVIGKNGLLGENFIQGYDTYSTSGIAVSNATLLIINKNKFNEIAFSEKQILTQWLQLLSLKMEVLTQSYSNLFFNRIEQRLSRSLIYLAKTYGVIKENNRIKISIQFTHQELADFIGSSRVTISNEISNFRKKGIISKNDGYYYIESMSKLKTIYFSDE